MENNLNKIKKIAKDVYKSLGSGYDEKVYDKAMQVGLQYANIKYDTQKVVGLTYKNRHVGEGYPDLIVYNGKNKAVVELKATGSEMGPAEERQLKNYLKILKIKRGLLINFQQPTKKGKTQLEIKEIK